MTTAGTETVGPPSPPRRAAASGIQLLARLGYVAKGLVYVIIGLLIFQLIAVVPAGVTEQVEEDVAAGQQVDAPETEDVFQVIRARPFGNLLLGAMAVGLAGYVLWRIVQAVQDTEKKGSAAKGVAQRIAYILMGLAYATIVLLAVQVLLGLVHGGGSDAQQDLTARALGWPGGQLLVGLFGVAVVAVAVGELYRAHRTDICEQLNQEQMHRFLLSCTSYAGKLGISARGLIYGIMGVFLIQAALEYEPEEVEGLGGALEWLAEQPFGVLLLGLAAAGLMSYGFYALVEARFRRVNVR
jgi:hypothetical protein